MLLKKLFLQNFLAVGDEPVEIDFSKTSGITVIRGANQDVSAKSSNGSGKSTIVEGIFFALTGSTLRKLTLPGIIHNQTSDECKVQIWFDNVSIVRTLKRQNKTVKSTAELYIDDVPKTTAAIGETKKLIDEMVGINFETLSNILIFGQHNIVSFLDAGEGEKREIIENLMNLREYNAYEENAKSLFKEAKTTLKSIVETRELHTKHLAEQQEIKLKQENSLKDYQNTLRRDIVLIDQRMAAIPDIEVLKVMWRQYDEYVDGQKKLSQRINDLISEKNRYQEEYNTTVELKQIASQGKAPLLANEQAVRAKLQVLEERKSEAWKTLIDPIDQEISSLDSAIDINKRSYQQRHDAILFNEKLVWEIKQFEQQIKQLRGRKESIVANTLKADEVCPTCYGVVDQANVQNVISSLDTEIAVLNEECLKVRQQNEAERLSVTAQRKAVLVEAHQYEKTFAEKLAVFVSQRQETETKINTSYISAKAKIDELLMTAQNAVDTFDVTLNATYDQLITSKQNAVASANTEIKKTQQALANVPVFEKPPIAPEEIGKLQAELDGDRKLKAEKEEQIERNPYIEMISTLAVSISKTEIEIATVKGEMTAIEAKMPYYEFWVDHMGNEGLKSYVVDMFLPTLNQQIDYWMQLIYQGNISVTFDKYFNVHMKNNASDNEMIFGQGSGGERRRVDIAIMLAFRQCMKVSTGRDPNVLFLDEICENLDEDGVYTIFSAMQELSKTNSLYVITHNHVLLGLLSNYPVLNVRKENGAMTIV